jgi:predicted TIM-barrel fold metal-dependent hydrolase
MIIDCHCHAGKGDIMTAPWNTAAPLDKYLRRARAAGVSKTVVFPAFHSNYRVANRELAKLVRAHGGRLIGFAGVRPRQDRGRVRRMLEIAVRSYGFRGLKVHGQMGFATREVCEAVRDFRIPLLFDVAGRAEVVDMLAPEFPTVDFIIPHFGSFADDWRAQQRVVEQLVRYPNVYADTSGVRRFDYLVEAVRRAGPEKVLFGSDGPWLHPGVEMAKVRALGLPAPQERLILGGNISRLLRKNGQPPPPVD